MKFLTINGKLQRDSAGRLITVPDNYDNQALTLNGKLLKTGAGIIGSNILKKYYNITATLSHVVAASGNAVSIGTGETVILSYTAASGYMLPDTVTVTGATGVWNKDAGTLTLSNPTANVTFTIAGVEVVRGYTVTLNNGVVPVPFNCYINENASFLVEASSLPLVLNNVYKIKLEIYATGNYLTNTTGSLVGHENDIFGNYVSITEDSSANVYTDQ